MGTAESGSTVEVFEDGALTRHRRRGRGQLVTAVQRRDERHPCLHGGRPRLCRQHFSAVARPHAARRILGPHWEGAESAPSQLSSARPVKGLVDGDGRVPGQGGSRRFSWLADGRHRGRSRLGERWSWALHAHADDVARRRKERRSDRTAVDPCPGFALRHRSEALGLGARGWQVTAVDFSATALAHARPAGPCASSATARWRRCRARVADVRIASRRLTSRRLLALASCGDGAATVRVLFVESRRIRSAYRVRPQAGSVVGGRVRSSVPPATPQWLERRTNVLDGGDRFGDRWERKWTQLRATQTARQSRIRPRRNLISRVVVPAVAAGS